jgi:prepilin-type N-terminal cleavage/methylation domain-containing protein
MRLGSPSPALETKPLGNRTEVLIGTRRNGRGAKGERGFTLLEVLISLVVFMIAAGASVSSLVSAITLGRVSRETGRALDAAHDVIERIQGETFAEVFARFNADPTDDPGGVGTAPGNLFAVPGLNVRPGDPDGFVGEILFPGVGGELRENVVDRELGMPRDLNGDGVVDVFDHSAGYQILPVRVRVQWLGTRNSTVVIATTIANT